MSNFRIQLLGQWRAEPRPLLHEYDPDLDCITSLLAEACEWLAETGDLAFVAHGCDGERWPVDVFTDLPVVVEQVPQALSNLRNVGAAELGFYEQGIEKLVRLSVSGSELRIECRGLVGLKCGSETMLVADGIAMLERFLSDFVEAVRAACPALASHDWFVAWLRGA